MKRTLLALSMLTFISGNPHLAAYAEEAYNADNTAINARDRNGQYPTAQNESNRKSAIKLVSKLRRRIMRTSGLSTDAQNIKIIDKHGCVVLRGPVDSEHEKILINDLAKDCCGNNFINQLEVKTK